MKTIQSIAWSTMMTALITCGLQGCGTGEEPETELGQPQPTTTGQTMTVSGASSAEACLFELVPVPGWSYQTPRAAQIGVAAVELLRSADDASPHRLVEHSPAHPADLIAGTTFVQVDTGSIPEGTYTHMRIKLDEMTFGVDATGHLGGLTMPGALSVDYALSDYTDELLGARTQGDYLAEFVAAGMTIPQAGVRPVDFPPSYPEAAVAVGGGEYWVTFLVPTGAIVISHEVPEQVDVDVRFCLEDGFAWAENDAAGHLAGIFDLDYDPMITEQPMAMAVRGFTLAVH